MVWKHPWGALGSTLNAPELLSTLLGQVWKLTQCILNVLKLISRHKKIEQMLQTDLFIVAACWCGRRDRMCWGEAWAFVATQPTGPEPWPLTLHPGGQTKLWVTSETRHSVGRECLDRSQITPLTPQKRFMVFYSALDENLPLIIPIDLSKQENPTIEACSVLHLVNLPISPSCMGLPS